MAGSLNELTAYAVILPVPRQPALNPVEEAVLAYLREGCPRAAITAMLGFDVSAVIRELVHKGLLYGDGSPRVAGDGSYNLFVPKDNRQCCIFRGGNQALFYNRLLYAHEIRLQGGSVLLNNLGDEYTGKDILKKLFIFDTYTLLYNPDDKEPEHRKITDFVKE
jgi:hypothetical protein